MTALSIWYQCTFLRSARTPRQRRPHALDVDVVVPNRTGFEARRVQRQEVDSALRTSPRPKTPTTPAVKNTPWSGFDDTGYLSRPRRLGLCAMGSCAARSGWNPGAARTHTPMNSRPALGQPWPSRDTPSIGYDIYFLGKKVIRLFHISAS
ncbi:hypothetical protein BC834DRAFT_408181 [Gloeopeniophorella convolvens]|nr:hypothetical protein BC834DRAFT_408181 [Gloeopeniophorella convolvens]